jgi:hypothetical protein
MSSITTKNERWTPVNINFDSTAAHSRTNNNNSNAMPIRSNDCSDHLRQILIEQDFRSAGRLVSSQHNLRRPYRQPSATNLTNVSPVHRNSSLDSSFSSMSSFGSFGSISEPQLASTTSTSKNNLLRYTNMTQDGSMSGLCNNLSISNHNNTSNSRWKSIPSKAHSHVNHQIRWSAISSGENASGGNDKPIGMIKRKSSTYLFPGAVSAWVNTDEKEAL